MNVLIIGATFGIGYELAKKYHNICDNLILLGRTASKLEEIKQEFSDGKTKIFTEILDVTILEDCKKKISNIIKTNPTIDKIIYCSGYYEPHDTFKIDVNLFQKTMNVNFMGMINVFSILLPHLKNQNHGHLGIVASLAGFAGLPNSSSYGPSKAAMMNYAESIKIDCDKYNIKVSIINPGFVLSRLTEKNTFDMPFLMTSERAANIIYEGLQKEKYEITFPLPMMILFKALRILPRSIYFWVVKIITKS
jgi:short-subunit dehydrogenase